MSEKKDESQPSTLSEAQAEEAVAKAEFESDEGSDLPTKWKTYRTNLRDITEQADPDNITWPTEPS